MNRKASDRSKPDLRTPLMATATLRLGPADHGRSLTLDEYLDAEVEPGFRYELARGVLEVTQVPNDPHAWLVCYFYDALSLYRRTHPGTRAIHHYGGGSEFQLVMPEMISGRNPDVAVAFWDAPRDLRGRRRASFAVEVVSRGNDAHERDYVTKRDEYLAYGLDEYWIVDPIDRRVTVLVREGDAWAESVVSGDRSAESVVLPGFVVPLAELWAGEEPDGE
jgi:Uma2 family endonuclease